ncbi:unnamed protein product [Porites evermanni]|uniref:Uncharacterized protein n=1 Tax=Porites evermanni TaxID=104178 RepID=A0ABN8SP00_9CNID|nr:unnamed protein product [Porites evermanni]
MEAETYTCCTCIIPSHLKCAWFIALTHIVVGMLLFVFGILDRLYNEYWIERLYFAVFCGVMMCITGALGILATRKNVREMTCCTRKSLAGTFLGFDIVSSVFGGVVFVSYGFVTAIRWGTGDGVYYSICDALCKSQKAIGFSIMILGILGCIIGCAGCCCVATSSGQAELISSPPNVSGSHPQIASMPPQSIAQETRLPPPYGVDTQHGSQDPDLLLVPLATTPVPPQETGRPPPYTGDTQTCSQGPDLLLVPLEATPIPPQEIDPPPPYHQISTTESDTWSLHDGDQPPPYSTCTEQQHPVMTYV